MMHGQKNIKLPENISDKSLLPANRPKTKEHNRYILHTLNRR